MVVAFVVWIRLDDLTSPTVLWYTMVAVREVHCGPIPATLGNPNAPPLACDMWWAGGDNTHNSVDERIVDMVGTFDIDEDTIIAAVQADECIGFCTACGEEAYGCEPDAREYECESCGEHAVFGAEELLLMRMWN